MSALGLALRALLALVFLAAALGKVRNRAAFQGFRDTLPTFGLTGPRAAVAAAAVPAAELFVALALARPSTVAAGYLVAAALLAGFTAGGATARRAGRRARCLCFGSRPSDFTAMHLARNGALLAAAVAGLAAAVAGGPAPGAATTYAAIALGAAGAGLVLLLDDLAFLFGAGHS